MARVTYGSGVTELAGSIGGVTYQKNASGNIARLKPKPTVNPTALQAGYQYNLAYIVSYWPTLSQANKDLWDVFAAAHDHTTPWGETKTLSGYQWFLVVNLNRLVGGYSVSNSPPGWATFNPPPVFTLTATATYLRCNWASPYTFPRHLVAYLTLPLRQSSLKLRRSLFIVAKLYNQTNLSTWDLTTEFEALSNVTWAAFYASADCSIICRLKYGYYSTGFFSAFTSAIVKI